MRKNLLALLVLVFLVGANAQQVFAYGEDGPPAETTVGVASKNENANAAIIEGGNVIGTSTTGVDVNSDSSNLNVIQNTIDFGSGDGVDKFGGLLPGAYYGPTPTGPEIPLPLNGVWNYKQREQIIAGFPTIVTVEMLDAYVANKTFFIKDQSKKDEIARNFQKAREMLLENANVVIFRRFQPSKAIRLSLKFPDSRATEGKDYLKMGTMTFQTREGLEKWYKELKLENITSDDLMAIFLQCARDIGANMVIPTGQGSETMFGTEAGGFSAGALLSTILSLSGPHALPTGGSLGGGFGASNGSNKVKAEPFLSVAFIAALNSNAVVSHDVEKKAIVNKLKKDEFSTLALCAKPVADPNGRTQLQVALLGLEKYLSSGKTDLEALSSFQLHLTQATRDNIKGEKLKVAQLGICLIWFERAEVADRLKAAGLISEAEHNKGYIDNLSKSNQSMQKYRIKSLPSLENYSSKLRETITK